MTRLKDIPWHVKIEFNNTVQRTEVGSKVPDGWTGMTGKSKIEQVVYN
jgi:hypothetical protein